MIFTFLYLLVLVFSLFDFKKGLMLYVICDIFCYSTPLFKIAGVNVYVDFVVACVLLGLYFVKRNRYNLAKCELPYALPFIFIIIAYFITCFFALSGFVREFISFIRIVLSDYILVWILWNTIENKKDFNYIIRLITAVIFFACLYGFYEYSVSSNALLDYKVMLSDDTANIYSGIGLRGYRLTSFFEHPLGGSMVFGLYSTFILTLWVKSDVKLPLRRLAFLTALICLPCVVLAKMRSSILFAIICALSILQFGKLTKKRIVKYALMIVVAVPICYMAVTNFSSLFENLITFTRSEIIGGSNLEMRLSQLQAIFRIFMQSPFAGLGELFNNFLASSADTKAALGYESVWFLQMVKHGLLGVISHLALAYYSIFKIPNVYKSNGARIFAIAYWLTYTITSVPSFRIYLFWLVEFYFIKTSEVYKLEQEEKRIPRIRFKVN